MPTRSSKSLANVARSSRGITSLKSKSNLNWQIAAAIGAVLVAAVGYLYVRLSRAGVGYTWTADKVTIIGNQGSRGDKNGQPVIYSVASYGSAQSLSVSVNSSVSFKQDYCFSGNSDSGVNPYSSSALKVSQGASAYYVSTLSRREVNGTAWKFCYSVMPSASSDSRYVSLSVAGNGRLWLTTVSREDPLAPNVSTAPGASPAP